MNVVLTFLIGMFVLGLRATSDEPVPRPVIVVGLALVVAVLLSSQRFA